MAKKSAEDVNFNEASNEEKKVGTGEGAGAPESQEEPTQQPSQEAGEQPEEGKEKQEEGKEKSNGSRKGKEASVVKTETKLVKVRTIEDIDCFIGGTRYTIRKDREASVPTDVAAILTTARKVFRI
jgi:hypothetical protein